MPLAPDSAELDVTTKTRAPHTRHLCTVADKYKGVNFKIFTLPDSQLCVRFFGVCVDSSTCEKQPTRVETFVAPIGVALVSPHLAIPNEPPDILFATTVFSFPLFDFECVLFVL